MFIRQLDYLSPYVTFYHKGNLSHNSIFSGILSIISITFIIVLAVYYALDIIQRTSPNVFYFNSFIEEAGTFYLNQTSLFHFIKSVVNDKGEIKTEKFDFTVFNIIGVKVYYNNYFNSQKNEGPLFDIWFYGYCDKETNTKGLDDIITDEILEKSICIKKFYNHKTNKTHNVGDPEFVWPHIAHGIFNDQNRIYNLMVTKCDDTLLPNILGEEGIKCKSDNELGSFFSNKITRFFHFYFVNNYINILNYENPNSHFLYRIETPLSGEQYTVNDINISPTLVKTHDGLVVDHIKEKISYMFDRNDAYIQKYNNKYKLYMVYNFVLKNIQEYYERSYKRIQDVIVSIGGINQAITIIAIYLNSFYNNYIVLSDTEVLLHSSIEYEKKIHKNNALSKKYLDDKPKSSKKKDKLKDIGKSSETRIESEQKNSRRKNKTENDITINNNSKSNLFNTNNKISEMIEKSNKNLTNSKINNKEKEKEKENEKEKGKEKEKEKEQNVKEKTFCNYLLYKLTCGKKKQLFNTYKKFRIKIISEEHLIRNHLNIYNLMKVTERKRHNRRNSYQLKDLINLV